MLLRIKTKHTRTLFYVVLRKRVSPWAADFNVRDDYRGSTRSKSYIYNTGNPPISFSHSQLSLHFSCTISLTKYTNLWGEGESFAIDNSNYLTASWGLQMNMKLAGESIHLMNKNNPMCAANPFEVTLMRIRANWEPNFFGLIIALYSSFEFWVFDRLNMWECILSKSIFKSRLLISQLSHFG